MPATLPNAKWGNLAVPPAIGYMAPSSAWTSARTMIAMPAMIQAMMDPVPVEYAAFHDANSQPEPMIDVSADQVAPINPISRLRPRSAGATVVVADSVAMSNPSFRFCYEKLTPASRPHGNDHQRA